MPEPTLARVSQPLVAAKTLDELERADLAVRTLLAAIDVALDLPHLGPQVLAAVSKGVQRRLAAA